MDKTQKGIMFPLTGKLFREYVMLDEFGMLASSQLQNTMHRILHLKELMVHCHIATCNGWAIEQYYYVTFDAYSSENLSSNQSSTCQ